ncbi:unnamed protein product [Effrenium voratum]|nr:unnamed protein product [Effrenium voratum]
MKRLPLRHLCMIWAKAVQIQRSELWKGGPVRPAASSARAPGTEGAELLQRFLVADTPKAVGLPASSSACVKTPGGACRGAGFKPKLSELGLAQRAAEPLDSEPELKLKDFELQQRIAAPKLKPSASSLSEGTVVGEQRSFRSGTIISEGDGLVMEKTLTSGSFTSFGGSSEVSDDELPELSPELAHLPEALLSLPGVVEELEMVVEEKRGEARRKAVEEECRKYLRWEAHEKPLNQLGDADIHPNFLNGNLNRYAVMANHALQQKDAALSPLIDPLPPTSSPSVLGDRPGTSRPGTRGSPVSASRPASASRASLSRPASALKPAASRPGSAARPASASAARAASGKPSRQGTVQAWVRPESAKKTAKRPGSARPPRTPLNAPARIEVANFCRAELERARAELRQRDAGAEIRTMEAKQRNLESELQARIG